MLEESPNVRQFVLEEGLKVLNAVERRYGYEFQYENGVVGGAAIDQYGLSLIHI